VDNPYEEEDDSDDTTATEGSDNHTTTAYELFIANPLQCITTNNKMFNANPFKHITKETGKFLRAANCKKQQKKLQG
jgi:calcineurin-like phosphoesterase